MGISVPARGYTCVVSHEHLIILKLAFQVCTTWHANSHNAADMSFCTPISPFQRLVREISSLSS